MTTILSDAAVAFLLRLFHLLDAVVSSLSGYSLSRGWTSPRSASSRRSRVLLRRGHKLAYPAQVDFGLLHLRTEEYRHLETSVLGDDAVSLMGVRSEETGEGDGDGEALFAVAGEGVDVYSSSHGPFVYKYGREGRLLILVNCCCCFSILLIRFPASRSTRLSSLSALPSRPSSGSARRPDSQGPRSCFSPTPVREKIKKKSMGNPTRKKKWTTLFFPNVHTICFIVCPGRCGSTLVTQMLEALDGVRCMSEPDFLCTVMKMARGGQVGRRKIRR